MFRHITSPKTLDLSLTSHLNSIGWNDPPPVSSIGKVKAEAAAVETISQPIFAMGVVEQPAIPSFQPFDPYNPTMMAPVEMMHHAHGVHESEPAPVQPVAALSPIPAEHIIIHDVFRTLKEKCTVFASNAVRNIAVLINVLINVFTYFVFYFSK